MVPDSMKIWSFLLVLGIFFPHWTQGIEIQRGSYNSTINEVKEDNQLNRTLLNVRCTKYSSDVSRTCIDSSILDLSDLGLNKIADNALDLLSGVETLDLRNNSLEKLSPRIFSKMTKLKVLELTNNKIRHCNLDFSGLDNFEYMDLRNNPIKVLKNPQLRNLPKSSTIIMNLMRIDIDDGSEKREHYQSHYEGPWYKHYSQLRPSSNEIPQENNYYQLDRIDVKVCKTNDGLMKSASILTKKGPFVGCWLRRVDDDDRILYLNKRNIKEFQSGWYNISNNFITRLDISSNAISEITPELLNDLPESIVSVDLSYNEITIIKMNVIENTYLRKLKILNNSISIIEPGAFEKTNLEEINMKGNFLRSLAFARSLPRTVTSLRLKSNQISEVPQDALVNLVALENLDLSRNRITHLPANIFRGCGKLRCIQIRNNLLETIESGTFVQETITEILLSDNKIRDLAAGSFKNLNMLKSLELAGNKIWKISRDTFTGIRDSLIRGLALDKNEIEIIEEGSFANMDIEFLYLDGNKLSERSIVKGAFQSCKVAHLGLESNLFTSINGESFYGLELYDSLSLQKNNIKSIEKGIVQFIGCPSNIDFGLSGVQRIKNGAFYGLRKCPNTMISFSEGIKVIEGGAFDN